jgi:hypothetical protein
MPLPDSSFSVDIPAALLYSWRAMYRVIGVDQREYGPVSDEQLRSWIVQGRLNARSLVQPEGSIGWKPLSDLPEFGASLAQAGPPAYPASTLAPIPTDNNMALSSLIVGCLSLVCCQPLAIVGIILGAMALNQIKSDPNKTGRGLAIAGIAVSIAAIVITALIMLLGGFKELMNAIGR